MAIKISFDRFECKNWYILADEIELGCLLDDSDNLSRSKIESILTMEDDNIDNFDQTWEALSSQFYLRDKTFPDYYPFQFTDDLLIKKENWSSKNKCKLYLNLLVASRLRFLDKTSQQTMAKKFEKICLIALRGWFNELDYKLFSPGSDDRRNFFGTDLREALKKLAVYIKETPHSTIDKLHHSGDKGLDIVGIRNFSDEERGSIVIFGQCAAKGLGWEDKVNDANAIHFNDYMTFSNKPINIFFIPAFYRKLNGTFPSIRPSENCLLIDRQRIFSMIKEDCLTELPLLDSFEIE